MKNKLRTTFFIACATGILFTGCKKNDNVVGNWTLSSASGTITAVKNGNTVTNTTTTGTANGALSLTEIQSPLNATLLSFSPYSLTVNINSNGTYNMNESYTTYGNPPEANTINALWEYSSSGSNNNIVTFLSNNSYLFNALRTSTFVINSVSKSRMVLSYNSTATSGTIGSGVITNIYSCSLTFTK